MSSYFTNFNLDKITSSLNSAAQKAQDKFNQTQGQLLNAIQSVNIDDKQPLISLKTHKRKLQESLGTIKDISELPLQYKYLEKKCDALEKACKRMLVITKTFEVESYDYPFNLSETFADWWGHSSAENLLNLGSKSESNKAKPIDEFSNTLKNSGSFANALGKGANESAAILIKLKNDSTLKDEKDEEIDTLIEMFQVWAKAQNMIEFAKQEMDQFMIKEFNKRLHDLLEIDFKKIRALRNAVENSRLKFDTLRYEVELEKTDSRPQETSVTKTPKNKEIQALLQASEDEFVSNTAEAVEFMNHTTDSTKLVTLVQLFHQFQLVYHQQCAQALQTSIHKLNGLFENTED